jgi:hypothetical protein
VPGGHAFLQLAIVFALIGLLGFVLKWTFSREKGAPRWPAESPTHAPMPAPSATTEPWPAGPPTPALPVASPDAPVQPDDYGLLASVAAVDSAQEAARVRVLLAEAGIRATTTVGADGKHRVLVFRTELHRARRVANGH